MLAATATQNRRLSARTTALTAVALALAALVAAPVAAQAQPATLVGGGRATVPLAATFTVPEIRQVRAIAGPVVTWQAERFTEVLLTFSVRTNTAWELVAEGVPAGVTVLTAAGAWTATAAAVEEGRATNHTEVKVRVRVADGATPTWADELRLDLRTPALAQTFAAR